MKNFFFFHNLKCNLAAAEASFILTIPFPWTWRLLLLYRFTNFSIHAKLVQMLMRSIYCLPGPRLDYFLITLMICDLSYSSDLSYSLLIIWTFVSAYRYIIEHIAQLKIKREQKNFKKINGPPGESLNTLCFKSTYLISARTANEKHTDLT